MSTQKNEHNPDWTPNQYGAPDWRLLSRDEDTQQDGDEWWDWEDGRWMLVEPHMFGKRPLVGLTYRRRITPPTDTTGSDLLSLLQQIEMHCPCGARPESLDTHPHVSGCPVEQALVIVRSGPPEGWQKYAENLAFKLGQSHRTTGSWREGETAGKAILLPFLVTVLSERHHTGSVTTGAQALIIHASDANSALGIGVKRYKDENPEAAISNTDVVPINMEAMPLVIELRAQVEALRRDGELWHLGPAKGGPNIWQDGDSLLIAVETSKGWQFALVGISADEGIASMEDYLGEFYGDYLFEDIAYWIHERDIIKLLPLRAAIDSAQRQEKP